MSGNSGGLHRPCSSKGGHAPKNRTMPLAWNTWTFRLIRLKLLEGSLETTRQYYSKPVYFGGWFSFDQIFKPLRIKLVCCPSYESVPSDFDIAKRAKMNGNLRREGAREDPITFSQFFEIEQHNFPVTQIVVAPSGPIPEITEQDSVQQVECLFRAYMPVVVSPSGDYRL